MKNLVVKAMLYMGVALAMGATSLAQAQATRTWVSGVGDDANPCSRTAPCKTFAGAISKTAANGIINVLDPGGYGAVTITKSITIDGGGHLASILGSATNGVNINTPSATDVVTLRRLAMNGAGTGLTGVRILSATGGTVVIEDSLIQGFNTAGIDVVNTSTNAKVIVRNVTVTGGASGIGIAGANALVTIDNVAIRHATTGINVAAGHAFIRGSDLVHNGTGIANSGGLISSYGDNMLAGNGSNGAGANYSIAPY